MQKIERADLYSLEKYSEMRKKFRDKVMQHKADRRMQIGPDATLYFEDRLTMHYQIQEMLRVERIFESMDIQEELDTYNPLIPDGSNWKATFMLEYDDPEERKEKLASMVGIESAIWMKVDGFDRITPIVDEDLDRSTEEKTSSIHFLRFELNEDMINSLQNGKSLAAGIDYASYRHTVDPVPDNIRLSLINDFN